MKIAVCLYGQPRTWRHTKGWIKAQYGEVDFFCSTKNYNSFMSDLKHVDTDEIDQLFQAFNPVRQRLEHYGQFEGYGPSHYLFKSMFASLLLKQQYELASGIHYDVVLLQRYDVITGPDLTWFKSFLANDFASDKLYVGSPHRFFPHEALQEGINDWIIGGSDTAMSLLMSGLVNLFNPGAYNSKTLDNELFSSHVMLKRICDDLGITVLVDTNMDSRIVREEVTDNFGTTIEELKLNWNTLTKVDK